MFDFNITKGFILLVILSLFGIYKLIEIIRDLII